MCRETIRQNRKTQQRPQKNGQAAPSHIQRLHSDPKTGAPASQCERRMLERTDWARTSSQSSFLLGVVIDDTRAEQEAGGRAGGTKKQQQTGRREGKGREGPKKGHIFLRAAAGLVAPSASWAGRPGCCNHPCPGPQAFKSIGAAAPLLASWPSQPGCCNPPCPGPQAFKSFCGPQLGSSLP